MRATVVLSTYNQPAWLEKSLWGYAVQSRRDFELVVADDGSGPETRAVIDRVRAETGLDIVHVWHEDRGFRKTVILNRAILAAEGDYVIFSDGDCIPRADFVETHLGLAEPGRFLSGSYIRLSQELSDLITIDDVRAGRFARPGWLWGRGFRQWRKVARLALRRPASGLLDLVTNLPARFDGNNVSVWKEALVAVNGFDMEMGWGLEDRSLGMRLEHIGIRGKQIRNRAVVFHLEHGYSYVTPEMVARNRAIAERVRRNREVRAPRGLRELDEQLESRGEVVAGGPPDQPSETLQ